MDRVPVAARDWGRGRALLFLAALIAALTLLGNWRAVERDPLTGQAAILDANSAWRLRRMALSLESTRLAQLDAALSFPHSVGEVSLPVYDHTIAFALRVISAGRVGGPRRVLNEGLLMRGALWVGPALLALLALGVFLWLRAVGGARRCVACMGALALVLVPGVLAAGQPGALVVELLAVLLLLVASRAVHLMFRAGSPLDRFTFAMVAGGLFGVGLATSPLFLIPTFGVWAAALFEALRAEREARAQWVRGLLLFWISAALGALLPALGGPWLPVQDGIVYGWTQLCVELALVGVAPFMALLWFPNISRDKALRRVLPAGLSLLVVSFVALAFGRGADHPSFAVLLASIGWDGNSGLHLVRWPELLALGVLVALVARPAWRACRERWSAWGVFLAAWGSCALLLASVHGPAVLFVLPVAGLCLVRGLRDESLLRCMPGLVLLSAIAGWDSHRDHAHVDEEALAAVALARELRASSDSPGAWNSVHPVQSWGVLADERLAPLMVWYGRRPCASLGVFRNADMHGRASLVDAWKAESVQEFEGRARRMGLRWILWGSGSARRLPANLPLSQDLNRLARSDSGSGLDADEWTAMMAIAREAPGDTSAHE